MTNFEVMYVLEHKLLPNWFFTEKERLVAPLIGQDDFVFSVLDDICKKENLENPYDKESFIINSAKLSEDILMIKLTFPEPDAEPLCYCSYLLFDINFEKTAYFCIEKGGDGCPPFVCRWGSDGGHFNCGTCTLEDNNDLTRCFDIYLSMYGKDDSDGE